MSCTGLHIVLSVYCTYVCMCVLQMVGTLSLFTCPTLLNRCRYLVNTGSVSYCPELCVQGLLKVILVLFTVLHPCNNVLINKTLLSLYCFMWHSQATQCEDLTHAHTHTQPWLYSAFLQFMITFNSHFTCVHLSPSRCCFTHTQLSLCQWTLLVCTDEAQLW